MENFIQIIKQKDEQICRFQDQIDRLISIIELLTKSAENGTDKKVYLITRQQKRK